MISVMWFRVLALCLLALAPALAGAHEVYVLTPEQIVHDIETPSPNPFDAFWSNQFKFFFWGFLAFVLVTTVFFMSITHRLEVFFEPFLTRLRPWAAPVARITLGVCLLASAYNNALFGPELPLSDFGPFALFIQLALYISGVLLMVGYLTRAAALAALAVFAVATVKYGFYILNYTNYLGEILLALLLLRPKFEPYAFLVLRVGFGISVAFAALYAKFLHSNLALSTVAEYNLTQFFPFDPLFIVLGACIIEVLMGLFFILGIEIRHTVLFFLFWIALSLVYFGESVWPHLVLVGVNISLFLYGYDRLTLEGRYFNRGKLQPFL